MSAPRRPVALDFHGETVVDDYLWLEDVADPEVAAWLQAQTARARAALDALPARAGFQASLAAEVSLRRALDAPVERGGKLFYRLAGGDAGTVLVARPVAGGEPAVVLDVAAAKPGWHVDFWSPSPDGAHVAVGLSPGGNESAVLHVVDVATAAFLPVAIAGCDYGGVAWTGPGSFAYTCFGPGGRGTARQAIMHHVLGDPAPDARLHQAADASEVLGVLAAGDGRYLLATAGRAGWPHRVMFLDRRAGPWRTLVDDPHGLSWLEGDAGGALYLISTADAPNGKVMAVPLDAPDRANWREIVPEGPEPLLNLRVLAGALALETMRDAASRLMILELDGRLRREIELPGRGTVGAASRAANNPEMLSGNPGSPDLYFRYTSLVVLPAVYRYDGRTGAVTPFEPTPAENPHVTELRWATSPDGTRVPITLVHPHGVGPGHDRPVLQIGYGGWGYANSPAYNPLYRAWLDAGGVVALAHLRGGGEYGQAWHDGGRLARKQNTFDDVHAATDALIAAGWARPGRVVLEGTSNGGLTVAAALVQRPDAYAAAVAAVPTADMLRAAEDPRGKLGVGEYGDPVADPVAYGWIKAYSPYHQVVDGAAYPPILLTAAMDDNRVPPWHAAKFAARLQAANPGNEVLLWVAASGGHRTLGSKDALVTGRADKLAFLWHHASSRPNTAEEIP